MKPAWIAWAIAVPALLVGGFVLYDATTPTPTPTAASAVAEKAPDLPGADAQRDAGAGLTAAQAPVVPPTLGASQPVGPATPAPMTAPVVAALSGRAAATAPPDSRVPPIDPPSADEPERAQPWEVADPALYRAREQRLEREVDTRFVQATGTRLPQLRAAVDAMRANGASASDIARAEDKIAHMQAVQDALLRGEPLAASAPIVAPSGGPAGQP
jgi:hypothetical protein